MTLLALLSLDGEAHFSQLVCVPLPNDRAAIISEEFKARNIVVPVLGTHGQTFVRVSYQAYNSQADADALVAAVKAGLASG